MSFRESQECNFVPEGDSLSVDIHLKKDSCVSHDFNIDLSLVIDLAGCAYSLFSK